MKYLGDIAKAAEAKFGTIKAIAEKTDGTLILLIERDNPTMQDAPYMTIRAWWDGAAVFQYGSYDLTLEDGHASFDDRWEGR